MLNWVKYFSSAILSMALIVCNYFTLQSTEAMPMVVLEGS